MEKNNQRPNASGGAGGAAMNAGDWKAQVRPGARQRIVNRIMVSLKRRLPSAGPERLEELEKLAVQFEEKTYTAAVSQSDYLQKISLKILRLDPKSQNTVPNSLPSKSSGDRNKPSDPGASMQAQGPNQKNPLPIPLSSNQSQAAHQFQLLPQARQRMVDIIMESLKRLLPSAGPERLEELKKLAVQFEEKTYTAAVSQSDYVRKISLKILRLEKSQNTVPNSFPSKSSGDSNKPSDPGASIQAQGPSQKKPLPIPLSSNQSQAAHPFQLPPKARQIMVNRLVETLTRHINYSGQDGLELFKRKAALFEEKIYSAATSQSEYVRKISLKMLTIETYSRNRIPGGNDERANNGNPM